MKHPYRLLPLLLACLLLLAAPAARAQMSGSDSLQAKLASVFAPLDKRQLPTGYLFEAAPKIFDWRYFHGTLTDTSLADMRLLRWLRLLAPAARLSGPADTLAGVETKN